MPAEYVFKLPDVGEGTTEAEISALHVQVGDRVEEDQPLVDVLSDKAALEITSPVSGIVVAIHAQIGERAAVGAPLVVFMVDDARGPMPKPTRATNSMQDAPGIDAAAAPVSSAEPRTGIEDIVIMGVRRKIAEKMQEAKRRIPHITYVEELDLTELDELRRQLNTGMGSDQPKLTLLPFFMRALVRVIPDHGQINARYDDDVGVLHRHDAVHLGIATHTRSGLLVPVVRHTEARNLWDCATELARVTEAARTGRATRDDMSGSTMTITSLGTLGGVSATHIINHPEVAIIGPNKLVERAIVKGGQIVVRKVMNLSSSFDHRIVDGYDAAQFIQHLKSVLESPSSWLLSDV
jgi:2-oxoisovalerate dehydrogenase E2 component (dihydrolipoyl transacylase)